MSNRDDQPLRRIVIGNPDDIAYLHDCQRIQVAMQRHGYDVSVAEAKTLWDLYSDSMCAGWMRLPDADSETEQDDMIVDRVRPYFTVAEEGKEE